MGGECLVGEGTGGTIDGNVCGQESPAGLELGQVSCRGAGHPEYRSLEG